MKDRKIVVELSGNVFQNLEDYVEAVFEGKKSSLRKSTERKHAVEFLLKKALKMYGFDRER